MTLVMVVNMKIMVFRDVKLCSLLDNAHVFRPGCSETERTLDTVKSIEIGTTGCAWVITEP
jgi:hypothetical protein